MKPILPNQARRLGFTLLELMVVLVLMAIMSAMIVPEMKGTFEDALLRSTSRDLVSVLNLAYSRAIAINQVHRVRLDPSSGKYFVETRVRGGERGDDFLPVRDVAGSEGKLDQRISIVIRNSNENPSEISTDPTLSTSQSREPESDNTISFYPDGTADRRDIQLKDRDGFQVSLQINPITARVRVIETERR
ncbi:MAG: prepilin-type N-terminal cleavage/methylation domain-containing protein [Verrucomicrobiota bacterium]